MMPKVEMISAVPPDLLEMALQDLYYVFADLDISTSLSNAIIALYQLYAGTGAKQEVMNLLRLAASTTRLLMMEKL